MNFLDPIKFLDEVLSIESLLGNMLISSWSMLKFSFSSLNCILLRYFLPSIYLAVPFWPLNEDRLTLEFISTILFFIEFWDSRLLFVLKLASLRLINWVRWDWNFLSKNYLGAVFRLLEPSLDYYWGWILIRVFGLMSISFRLLNRNSLQGAVVC